MNPQSSPGCCGITRRGFLLGAAAGLGAGGALQEAHAAGVTYQDVKPRNVLLDEAGQVRLADFGLARLRQAGGEGPLGSTLAYMAPEQARKEVEKIGPASDVFGLGGVLYFLLTG